MAEIQDIQNEINSLERKVKKYSQQLAIACQKLQVELEKQTPKKETTKYGKRKEKKVRQEDNIEVSGSFTSKL